jgi:predicted kinase
VTPLLVVVTGAPASGKTSVASHLASRLRVPVLSKDTFKERLYEVFGSGDELEPQIEAAGLAILFSVVAMQLEAGVSVLAESNFDADSDLEPFRRLDREHDFRLVQIHCNRPNDELLDRFVERVEEGSRHPGHGDAPEDVDEVRAKLEAGVWDPLDLPGVVIEVDKGAEGFSYDQLAERVRAVAEPDPRRGS